MSTTKYVEKVNKDDVKVRIRVYDREGTKIDTQEQINEALLPALPHEEEGDHYYRLGVDRANLIDMFGRETYHAVFAPLDPSARLQTMLEML